jgi:hypothetical protein
MRNTTITICLAAMVFSVTSSTVGFAQQDDSIKNNVATFMRAKLAQAQKVLEGLTTENFNEVAKSSQEMSLLSQAAQWQVIQTPEYARRSAEFRREADALTDAARKKNIEAATLAYVKVTINCVECHKYVRSVKQARVDNPSSRVDGLAAWRGKSR